MYKFRPLRVFAERLIPRSTWVDLLIEALFDSALHHITIPPCMTGCRLIRCKAAVAVCLPKD